MSKHFRFKHPNKFDRVINSDIEDSHHVEAKEPLAKILYCKSNLNQHFGSEIIGQRHSFFGYSPKLYKMLK